MFNYGIASAQYQPGGFIRVTLQESVLQSGIPALGYLGSAVVCANNANTLFGAAFFSGNEVDVEGSVDLSANARRFNLLVFGARPGVPDWP